TISSGAALFSHCRNAKAVWLVAAIAVGFVCSARAAEPKTLEGHSDLVTDVAFSPDGKLLATVGGRTLHYRPGEVFLWDASTGEKKGQLEGHDSTVWGVAFSPDGKMLATAAYDKVAKLWELQAQKELRTLSGHDNW